MPLNKYVYWVALPALLFLSIGRTPIADLINGPFIAVFLGSSAIVWVMGSAIGRLVGEKSFSNLVMQGMNASFANVGYMGIPLFVAALGTENIAPALLATVMMSVISVPTAVVALELGSSTRNKPLQAALRVGLALAKNPLLVSSVAGLFVALSGLTFPQPIFRLLDILAVSASPCALVAIGLFIASRPLKAGLMEVGWLTVIKLIWHPLICWWLILGFFPLDPYWAAGAIILSALPTGTLTFVVAQQYGVYVERTSGVILISTIVSVITLSLVMALYGPSLAVFANQ